MNGRSVDQPGDLVMTALQELAGEITLNDSELGGALFTVFVPKRRKV